MRFAAVAIMRLRVPFFFGEIIYLSKQLVALQNPRPWHTTIIALLRFLQNITRYVQTRKSLINQIWFFLFSQVGILLLESHVSPNRHVCPPYKDYWPTKYFFISNSKGEDVSNLVTCKQRQCFYQVQSRKTVSTQTGGEFSWEKFFETKCSSV